MNGGGRHSNRNDLLAERGEISLEVVLLGNVKPNSGFKIYILHDYI